MTAFKRIRALPTENAYLCAVETIIRDIQRNGGPNGLPLDLVDIAESIDASVGTISNAVNQKASLNPTYLARLGTVYGSGYLNPYMALFQAQAAPLDGTLTSDILPMVVAVAHKIAMARDPAGPGGVVEVPQEKAGYLPELKQLQTRSAHLVKEIEAAL